MDNRIASQSGGLNDAAVEAYEAAIERGDSGPSAMKAAAALYPEAASFLADYALSVAAADAFATDEPLAVEQARVVSRGDAIMAARFSPSASPLSGGVIDAAKRTGLTLAALSQSVSLARSVLVKLDRRLIEASTVPESAVERIASALGASAAELQAHLSLPPTLGASASYKAQSAPTIDAPDRQSFDDALDAAVASGEMTQSEADAWKPTGQS